MTSNAEPVPSRLRIELLSDATFGRGEGTAGAVDTEVEHDRNGLPFIGGKTVRGLLRDSWLSMSDCFPGLRLAAEHMLGPSRSVDATCTLRIGDARLPALLLSAIESAVGRSQTPLFWGDALAAFTSVRHQTAENRTTGAPEPTSLRSTRVVLRGFCFDAPLTWINDYEPTQEDLGLLALCALVTRHGGLLRNRGRGHIRISLDGNLTRTRTLARQGSKEKST